jgi:hypothetical protein
MADGQVLKPLPKVKVGGFGVLRDCLTLAIGVRSTDVTVGDWQLSL